MNYIKSTLVAAALLGASMTASAADECSKYPSSYDQTYCFSKLFVESDKELNDVYKELRRHAKGNTGKSLVATQRSWIAYRENACQRKAGTIIVDCSYDINRERTEYLRDRLRECKTGNCRADMITRQSW